MAGYFLALGDQGPTGGLFRLAYEHVPGFVMMREPDKFAVLVALAYAYGFGSGIAWLTNGSRQKAAQVAATALAIALPLAYTPNLLGGLGGQVKASELPSSWSFASRLAGHATVLFLPWHEYFPTPFTEDSPSPRCVVRDYAEGARHYGEGAIAAAGGYWLISVPPLLVRFLVVFPLEQATQRPGRFYACLLFALILLVIVIF